MNGEGGRRALWVRYIPALLLCAVVVLYCAYHLIASFTGKLQLGTAGLVTLTETEKVDVCLFRHEQVLASPYAGVKVDLAEDGEKVAAGTPVARIYTVFSEPVYEELTEVDRRLDILHRAKTTYSSLKNAPQIRAQIDRDLAKYNAAVAENDLASAMLLREEILAASARYQALIGGYDTFSDTIAALELRRAALEQSLGTPVGTMIATESGYYYGSVDGFESRFSASDLDSMTVDSYRELLASEAEPYAAEGQSMGKLVTDFRWYAACEVSAETADKMKTDGAYEVYFPYNDATVTMTLYRTAAARDEDAVLLILAASVMPEGFDYTRVQKAEITVVSHTGYSVPVTAVRTVDGKTGVYILDRYEVRFRQVSILYEKNGVYLSDPTADPDTYLDLYDAVILNGKNLYEGKLID